MNVLLIEDNISLVNSLSIMMRELGHKVYTCYSGKEAIDFIKNKKFDLIILEALLPDMEGRKIIDYLKKINIRTHIIFLTDSNSRDLEKLIRQKGVLFYMVKPLEIDKLENLLKHLLKR